MALPGARRGPAVGRSPPEGQALGENWWHGSPVAASGTRRAQR